MAYFDREKSFSELGLDRRVFKAVARLGYVYPTLIQARCIPLALSGKDILARARTGSGKTFAYGIPIVQTILSLKEASSSSSSSSSSTSHSSGHLSVGVRALVLVPTKELCDQVRDQLTPLLYYCSDKVSLCTLSSKASLAEQVPFLRENPDIIISTPSRLLEHLRRGSVAFRDSLKMLVIDEADLLLSYGYQLDVSALLEHVPRMLQSLLMSATLNPEVESLRKLVLHSPVVLKLEEGSGSAGDEGHLQQYYLECSEADKFLVLYTFIRLKLIQGKSLFFVNSVERCFRLKLFLEQFSISSAVLNAELPANSRYHILQQFNRGVFDYLIATDASIDEEEADAGNAEAAGEDDGDEVKDDNEQRESASGGDGKPQPSSDTIPASSKISKKRKAPIISKAEQEHGEDFGVSRGVDFQNVTTVVNFDFPVAERSYVHRVGRTARGGASGVALSLVGPVEVAQLHTVMRHLANVDEHIPIEEVASTGVKSCPLQPLPFRKEDLEGFRYRVEDVMRAVTQAAVREARVKEFKAELLHSEKLRAHFEDNPKELALLKHDKVLRPAKVQKHLQHVPDYLIPSTLCLPDPGIISATNSAKRRKRGQSKNDRSQRSRVQKGKQEPSQGEAGQGHTHGQRQGQLQSKGNASGKSKSTSHSRPSKPKSGGDPLKSFSFDGNVKGGAKKYKRPFKSQAQKPAKDG